jgi:excisionase family DNA binding protein
MEKGTIIALTPDEISKLVEEGIARALAPFTSNEKEFFTRKEVADRFSVTLGTIHNWMNSCRLNAIKVGGRTLFRADEVERFEREGRVFKFKN